MSFSIGDRKLFGRFALADRVVASKSSYVSVKYWHYTKQDFGPPSNLYEADSSQTRLLQSEAFKTEDGVLEGEISSLRVSKSLDQASGTFELELFPNDNWKSRISPGDWVAIYIFDNYQLKGAVGSSLKNCVMLGNVDRISRSLQKEEESDKIKLRYVISGRNFGKVFEDTDVWYNPFEKQEQTLDVELRSAGFPLSGNPSELVDKSLNVFLGGGQSFERGRSSPLGQWRIPGSLIRHFKLANESHAIGESSPLFFDILRKSITPNLPGYKANQMISVQGNGSLWDILKRSSNGMLNELFLEDVRNSDYEAVPTLILRPRPLNTPFLDTDQFDKEFLNRQGKDLTQAISLQEFSKDNFIEVSFAEIKYENLGKDDHSRFNMFWMDTAHKYEYVLSVIESKGIGNPTIQRQAIQRHGLKRMEQVLEFCYQQAGNQNAPVQGPNLNTILWKSFMSVLYDMHSSNHLYDAGTITCTGVIEAELGKALVVKPQSAGGLEKIFYIQGYEHSWQFPNTWTTTFTLSHGQFRSPTRDIFIDLNGKTGDKGQRDSLIDAVYVAKTITEKE